MPEDDPITIRLLTDGAARKAATCGYETGFKCVWSAAFSFTATLTIAEVGIFDARKEIVEVEEETNGNDCR